METETFGHLFEYVSGLYCPSNLRSIQFSNFCNEASVENVRKIAKFLLKYSNYKEHILLEHCGSQQCCRFVWEDFWLVCLA